MRERGCESDEIISNFNVLPTWYGERARKRDRARTRARERKKDILGGRESRTGRKSKGKSVQKRSEREEERGKERRSTGKRERARTREKQPGRERKSKEIKEGARERVKDRVKRNRSEGFFLSYVAEETYILKEPANCIHNMPPPWSFSSSYFIFTSSYMLKDHIR